MSKLVLDDFELDPIYLLGIYSHMESYRLAYHLNRVLHIQLKRAESDVNFYDRDGAVTNYPFFMFYNEKEDITYTLFENKTVLEKQKSNGNVPDLFAEFVSVTEQERYLIPEESQVDFFLKIETELLELEDFDHLIPIVKEIPQIITVRYLDYEGLRSKNNLIF